MKSGLGASQGMTQPQLLDVVISVSASRAACVPRVGARIMLNHHRSYCRCLLCTFFPLSWFIAVALPSWLAFLLTARASSLSPHHCLWLFVVGITSSIFAPFSAIPTFTMTKLNWKTAYLGSRPLSYRSLFKDTMTIWKRKLALFWTRKNHHGRNWTSSFVLFYGSQLNIRY